MSYKNPIMRDDPNAIDKLCEKLAECERLQDTMKEVNSYYRKEGKVIGCPCLTEKQAEALVIIPDELFYQAQDYVKQRDGKNEEKRKIALTNRSQSLLSGIVY